MKKITVTLFALIVMSAGFAQQGASSETAVVISPTAAFRWSETTHDFGKTKVSQPVGFEFRFSNAGQTPLIISSVKTSCGCTVTAYTKEPVAPGASGFVRATYDAAKTGVYHKTVAVSANTPGGVINLTIKGEIVE